MAINTSTIFVTTTLRGILSFDLTVQTAKSNMHSGFSGPYPNPYFIMNQLLARVVNFETQELLPEFECEIPQFRVEQTHDAARKFPETDSGFLLEGVSTTAMKHQGAADAAEKLHMNLKEWWKPALAVIGIEGLPTDLATAGNVVYKQLKYRLSVRTAPT